MINIHKFIKRNTFLYNLKYIHVFQNDCLLVCYIRKLRKKVNLFVTKLIQRIFFFFVRSSPSNIIDRTHNICVQFLNATSAYNLLPTNRYGIHTPCYENYQN